MQAAVAMDPWAVTAQERARHAEQFASLGPGPTGFITGVQAKGFFMQSGLTPVVLAQIWGLADINGDGQMDLNEFSIACKLITMKLKGFEPPAALPSAILAIPAGAQPVMSMGMVTQPQPMVSMAPMTSMGQMPMMTPGMPQPGMAQPVMGLPVTGVSMAMQQPGMPAMSMPMQMTQMVTAPQPVAPPIVAGTPTQDHEWDVPLATQSKYGAIFTQTDKAKVGALAGAQARNILLQSGLPQNILAQIWTLSDVDKDGRLSREEFILSGHLCDMAAKGEPLPAQLPVTLLPALHRPARNSAASTPASGSVADSFEDRRRENFNRGQQELERRRQSLIDQQKREEEERKKKEKEEEEERKKKREEEERQRLIEWEAKRKEQLLAHRQSEEDKLVQLKARQQNINGELDAMREKVKDLTTGISDTRTGISDVKTFIDGMRNSRDEKVQEMNNLKARLREQNERLLKVTQEKAQMEARNKANAENLQNGEAGPTDFELKVQAKEKELEGLRQEAEATKERKTAAEEKHESMKGLIKQHQEELEKIIESCKVLYSMFDEKRREIRAEKSKRIREMTDPDHAWGNVDEPAQQEAAPVAAVSAVGGGGEEVAYVALYDYQAQNDDELSFAAGDSIMVNVGQAGEPGWLAGRLGDRSGWIPEAYLQRADAEGGAAVAAADAGADAMNGVPVAEEVPARALYDAEATNEHCLALKQGDAVTVMFRPEGGEWWYGKTQDGALGYFPSAYVALDGDATPTSDSTPAMPANFVPLSSEALYAYQPKEEGDLEFDVGEVIQVLKMEAEWWTGRIGDDDTGRKGVFPYNYVRLNIAQPSTAAASGGVTANDNAAAAQPANDAAAAPATTAGSEDNKLKTSSMKRSKKKKKDSGDGTAEKKKVQIAKVVASYEATSKEQLSLTAGQMIVVRKRTDTGWWQGEVQGGKGKKKVVGWFPATYVQLMEGGGGAAAPGGGGGSQPAAQPAEDGGAGGGNAAGSAGGSGKCRALYDYNAQQEDELTFTEGAEITILSKEDEVWWKGQLPDGAAGVFPANYVEEI